MSLLTAHCSLFAVRCSLLRAASASSARLFLAVGWPTGRTVQAGVYCGGIPNDIILATTSVAIVLIVAGVLMRAKEPSCLLSVGPAWDG